MVTGAASGIGLAAAQGFASLGATVLAVARNEQRARDAEKALSGDVRGVACDVSSVAALRELAANVERLDVLVNNAGVMPGERSRSVDDVELTFATHVLGPFVLIQALAPVLEANAPARVINVTSGGMYTPGAAPRRPHVRATTTTTRRPSTPAPSAPRSCSPSSSRRAWPAPASSSIRCTRAGPTPPASSTRCRVPQGRPARSCAATRRARTRSSGSAAPPSRSSPRASCGWTRGAPDPLPLRRLAGRRRGPRGAVDALRTARHRGEPHAARGSALRRNA